MYYKNDVDMLTTNECYQLLEKGPITTMETLILQLLIFQRFRPIEIVSLTRKDINLTKGLILRKSRAGVGGWERINKNVTVLKIYLAMTKDSIGPELFGNGKRMSYQRLNQIIQRCAERARVRNGDVNTTLLNNSYISFVDISSEIRDAIKSIDYRKLAEKGY